MSEEKSVLRPAEENPYYCLATLYGEDRANSGLNRFAWNRWMADGLNEERRAELLKQGSRNTTSRPSVRLNCPKS